MQCVLQGQPIDKEWRRMQVHASAWAPPAPCPGCQAGLGCILWSPEIWVYANELGTIEIARLFGVGSFSVQQPAAESSREMPAVAADMLHAHLETVGCCQNCVGRNQRPRAQVHDFIRSRGA